MYSQVLCTNWNERSSIHSSNWTFTRQLVTTQVAKLTSGTRPRKRYVYAHEIHRGSPITCNVYAGWYVKNPLLLVYTRQGVQITCNTPVENAKVPQLNPFVIVFARGKRHVSLLTCVHSWEMSSFPVYLCTPVGNIKNFLLLVYACGKCHVSPFTCVHPWETSRIPLYHVLVFACGKRHGPLITCVHQWETSKNPN